jgi:hypothetical protein
LAGGSATIPLANRTYGAMRRKAARVLTRLM